MKLRNTCLAGCLLLQVLVANASAQYLGEAVRFPDEKTANLPSGRIAVQSAAGVRRQAGSPAVGGNWIDISNLATVRNAYLNQFAPLVPTQSGWSGDVVAGIAGSTSQAYKDAALGQINWFRAMAGVPALTGLDPTYSAKDQDAAMMMSANNALSHSPPTSWLNYTANGAEAAGHSNICLGYTLQYDPGCVRSYIDDFGNNNYEVGHRRWILYPQTQLMGTGDVTPGSPSRPANALWVFDANLFGPRPATRDTFVAWPPPGYVPYNVVFPRWSLSSPGADFTAATVTMTQDGLPIPVRLETVVNGYGENTLVWVPNNLDANSQPYLTVKPASSTVFKVHVANVGGGASTFDYTVTVFDPAPSPVTVTISSVPSNLGAFVDGTFVSSPGVFSWIPGDSHALSYAIYPPSGTSRTGFGSWSDGGGAAHSIIVPNTSAGFTVNYTTQYLLTLAASPSGAGTVTANPSSVDGFYNSGSSIQLTASANSGYSFSGFSGSLTGATNPQSVTMSAARSVSAQFTASQPVCSYTLSPPPSTLTAAATTLSATITTTSGCAWSTTGIPAWLTATTATSGTNSGSVSFTVAANVANTSRSATMTIAGQSYSVTQAGAAVVCSYALSSPPSTLASTAATLNVTVTTTAGCAWSTTGIPAWLTATSATSGTGSGSVSFSVAANSSVNGRNATLTIGGQSFPITQAGTSQVICTYTLSSPPGTLVSIASTLSITVTTTAGCAWSVTGTPAWLTPTTATSGTGAGSVSFTVAANPLDTSRNATLTIGGQPYAVTQAGAASQLNAGLLFIPIAPCRIVDTRGETGQTGAFGPPVMQANSTRDFPLSAGSCGIPITAQAYSLNVTVVPQEPLQYVSIWPAGQTQPLVSTLNSFDGRIVANAAIVPAGANGAVSVYASNKTQVVIDLNGYFDSVSAQGLAFYPATPCRVADTRSSTILPASTSRDFALPSSVCHPPATAQAYSLNVTVVPAGGLPYLTAWPTGQAQPFVSTLNSLDGSIVANAAIVPAGQAGSVSAFVAGTSDVILDTNGYFAASASAAGGLRFYPVTPCRVSDTRNPTGAFGAPSLAANTVRNYAIPSSGCGIPSTAQAYAMNVTVVPAGGLSFLTMWPTGQTQPVVSTLNSFQGKILANAAIVPAGTNGSISVYVTNATDVILDVNGYFAP